jgi:hypothetical protein
MPFIFYLQNRLICLKYRYSKEVIMQKNQRDDLFEPLSHDKKGLKHTAQNDPNQLNEGPVNPDTLPIRARSKNQPKINPEQ